MLWVHMYLSPPSDLAELLVHNKNEDVFDNS